MSAAPRPTVGVYVVTLNRAGALKRCLESISAQTRAPAEVVVVDNGSTDGTVAIVRADFPEVSLLELQANLGCPGGRNLAAQQASADVLFFVDDDSVLAPNAVERAEEAALGDERIAVFAPRIIEVREGRRWALLDGPPRDLARFIGQCVIRRKLIPADGLYPAGFLKYGEEQAFALRLIERQLRIVYDPSIVIHHFPESVARKEALEMVWNVQGHTSVKWRLLPYRYALPSTVRTLAVLLPWAVRTHTVQGYLRGVAGVPRVIHAALRNRTPVSMPAWRRYRELRATEGRPVLLDDSPWD